MYIDFHRSQDNIPASLAAFEQDDAMHHLELSMFLFGPSLCLAD
jgi:hypothetical protein